MDPMELVSPSIGFTFWMLILFLFLIPIVVYVVALWKVFEKAGHPAWASLIPFYSLYIYTQIIKRPEWWMTLYFLSIVPIIGLIVVLVISVMDTHRLSKSFGKDGGFTVGLVLLGFVFYPILAFSDATYNTELIED